MLRIRLMSGLLILFLAFGCATQRPEEPRAEPVAPAAAASRVAALDATALDEKTFDGKVVLFGNLHAHSQLSDDIRPSRDELSPENAYAYARDHGIDFLALSDHHKAADASNRLSLDPDEYRERLFDVAMAFNAENPGFIAIPAIEWGNTATGNHLNVIGPDTVPPEDVLDAEYDELFAWAAEHAEFVQLNHPNSWQGKSNRNRDVGNFGEARYPDTDAYVAAVDPVAKTISIITTVQGGHLSGQHRHSEAKTHRRMQWEKHYKDFLNKGFHLSPAANQDTHHENWGTVTAARTAVWADDATYEGLMAGFLANRVYATQDDEMAVVYQVRYDDETYWMGDTVPLAEEEADVTVLVRVWQVAGSDGDPTDEGPYEVVVMSDWDGIEGRQAAEWVTLDEVPAGELSEIPLNVVVGEYIYLQVRETNGRDNPIGDGEDEFINGTDVPEPDGKRDDMDDAAWTSPIWFTAAPTAPALVARIAPAAEAGAGEFVWSTASSLYHVPGCWAVSQIGRGARRSGPPPADKKPHSCVGHD